MVCSEEDCVNPVDCRGLCSVHYRKKRYLGELGIIQKQYHGIPEIDRLMKRVSKQPNNCWKWLGSYQNKHKRRVSEWHGQWRNSSGNIELVHRASWRRLAGDTPKGVFVLHRCDNPLCVNPDHLFLGTQRDNVKDMWDKGRARQGVSKGENHGCSKLTESQVIEIRTSSENGPTVARRVGVSTSTVYDIRNRKIWTHI